jgi:hypothetical protein
VGAGVSSVVCASALIVNAPDSANVKTAKLAMNLLFMTHLSEPNMTASTRMLNKSPPKGVATAMPKRKGTAVYKSCVFTE